MSTPKDELVKHKIPRKTAEELAMEELDIAEALDEEENEDAAFWKADAKERLRIARINRELEAEEQRELRRWKRGNTLKDNRTPQEAGMHLLRKPTTPKAIPISFAFSEAKHQTWKPFIHEQH